jgi:hypothetical protein
MRLHIGEMSGFREKVRDLIRLVRAGSSWRRYSNSYVQERAIELLVQNLYPSQRKQYERFRHFDVVGGDSGRHYRIRHGDLMNVEQLDKNGKRIRVLCFMPAGQLPIGDVMLAQKIALELFETGAIAIANKDPPRRYVMEEEELRWLRRSRRAARSLP